jgi:carbon storage regulator
VLILSRREAETICLGEDVVVTVVSVSADKVRLGIKAPPGVRILRKELEAAAAPKAAVRPVVSLAQYLRRAA